MMTTAEALAAFATAVRYNSLPEIVRHETKRLLLDSIGCALAGAGSEKGRWGLHYARRQMAAPCQATVLGSGTRLSTAGAAFANGELINALDYDASGKPGHVPPFVIPAALAAAEAHSVSGETLIAACAVGHEVANRVGAAMGSFRDIKDGVVEWPKVTGYSSSIFGAAAAVGRLNGLPTDRLAHGLGLAGHLAPMQTQSAWINSARPTSAKYLMAGWLNQAAIAAIDLATAGHRGNLDVLDGEHGFWRFAGARSWDAGSVLANLGTSWRFPLEMTYKQYPNCRIMHGALDALSALLQREKLRAEDIEHVHLQLEASCVQAVFANTDISSQVDAQFSIAYGVAMVALGIEAGAQWQRAEVMRDEAVRAFMQRVTYEPHPEYVSALNKDSKARPSSVELSTRRGRFREERTYIKGTPTADPTTAMSDSELLEKFVRNSRGLMPEHEARSVGGRLMKLEEEDNIARVIVALAGSDVEGRADE